MKNVQILIAGISATGKSQFGRWLAETRGFLHVDMELEDAERYSWGRSGLRDEWNSFCDGSDRHALIRELKSRTESTVLNWGFPPHMLPVVSELKANGVSLWWFEGERAVARRVYEERERRRLAAADSRSRRWARRWIGWPDLKEKMALFDAQYEGLSRCWPAIEPLFHGHIITTLRPDSSFMKTEEIFSKMEL